VPPVSKRWRCCLATSSRPQSHLFQKGGALVSHLLPRPHCHLFQKGGALLSHLLPGPCVTRFKNVERSSRAFFQAPVSPVSKRWSAYVAPSSRSHCHPFQKGGALVSHLLCSRLSCSITSSLPLPSAFSLVSRAGTAAKDEPGGFEADGSV
jgi:hypothetical protein